MIKKVGLVAFALVMKNGHQRKPTLVSLSQQVAHDQGDLLLSRLDDDWSFEVVPVPVVNGEKSPSGTLFDCDT